MVFLILSKEASIIFYNLKMRAQLGHGAIRNTSLRLAFFIPHGCNDGRHSFGRWALATMSEDPC